MNAGDGAEEHNEEDLKSCQYVGDGPVHGCDRHEADPEARVKGILLFEAAPLVDFPPERADNAHAGQVLLNDGGENALLDVDFFKCSSDLHVKNQRVDHDDRDHERGAEHDTEVDPAHENKGQHDHDDCAEELHELLRDESLDGVHVRGAPLDDVSGAVLAVPCVGQVHDVGEEIVAHFSYKCLRAPSIHSPENISAQSGQTANHKYRGGDPDRVGPESACAADICNQSLYDARKNRGLGADDGVDGVGYDFRVHHIKQGYESRKNHAEGKVALGTREEMQY